MSRFIQAIHRFFFDESSPAAVEYALLIALIAVVIVVGARTMGNETKDVFEDLADFLKLAI
ncbi:MAG: Flp family type IVb pilin [Planctomycetes bacterium]|nr:Flp family type IVb pilin [Planctomycetota bacterium]